MGEIERKMVEQHRHQMNAAAHQQESRELSHRRAQEFVGIMRAHNVGKTALYEVTTHVTPIPGTFFRPKPSTRYAQNTVRYTYELADAGWVVAEPDPDGNDSHYMVLDSDEPGEVYRCTYPGYHRAEMEKRRIKIPESFMLVSAPMKNERNEDAFGIYTQGVEMLADAAKKYLEA